MAVIIAATEAKFLAADRVWIATALLHQEYPKQPAFTLDEIEARGRREGFVESGVNTFYVHANQHCVANRPPNPGRHRMLTEIDGKRRLYRPGDPVNPGRTGKFVPDLDKIPVKYHHLIAWYERWAGPRTARSAADPLLDLRGSGKKLWADEHADDYVRRLREGWR